MSCSELDIMLGQGSQSESENGMWHHAQTSKRKIYILHIFWKDNKGCYGKTFWNNIILVLIYKTNITIGFFFTTISVDIQNWDKIARLDWLYKENFTCSNIKIFFVPGFKLEHVLTYKILQNLRLVLQANALNH